MAEIETVTHPVLIAVTALPGAMFWRENSGLFLTLDGRRHVRAGVDGIGDVMGVFNGRAVAIETKTQTGRFEASQKHFRDKFTRSGGLYIVARCPEDAINGLLG